MARRLEPWSGYAKPRLLRPGLVVFSWAAEHREIAGSTCRLQVLGPGRSRLSLPAAVPMPERRIIIRAGAGAGFDVVVEPPPEWTNHNRERATHRAARRYADSLRIVHGWPVVDQSRAGPNLLARS